MTKVLALIAALAGICAAVFSFRSMQQTSGKGSLGPEGMQSGGGFEATSSLSVGDSPVMASGGSMTFRLRKDNGQQWACDTVAGQLHTKCVSQAAVNTSNIGLEDVWPQSPGIIPGGTTGATLPWSIVLYPRTDAGALQQGSARVTICPSASNLIASASCAGPFTGNSNYILVQASGNSADTGNPPVKLVDSNASDDGSIYAIQYYDPACNVHNGGVVPACEHPGTVTTTLSGAAPVYKCRHGNCRISIG